MLVILTGTLIIEGLKVGDVGGSSFTIKLISATKPDGVGNGLVKLEDSASSEGTLTPLTDQSTVTVTFPWSTEEGIPGAFLIWSHSKLEFLLVSLRLDDIPNYGPIYFDCNSWVYPEHIYEGKPRIFFYNKSYLPSQTPEPLRRFREIELKSLRGNGTGVRQTWQRIYDYDFYNDLGNPDVSQKLGRPVLGGSNKYPYPRRGRTGRPPTNTDPNSESRVPEDKGFSIYVPRDERFSDVKLFEFISYFPKSVISQLKPFVKAAVESQGKEFDSFKDEREILYKNGFKFNVPKLVLDALAQNLPIPTPPADGNLTLLFPTPSVIQESLDGWMTDEEFARQMLAGVNPNLIRLLQEFPPKSNLDVKIYGDQNSKITKAQLKINLNGLTVEEALKNKRLFILDHHDGFMPFLRLINNDTSRKAYATRTILFLKDDGTLKPLAIELSLPHPDGDRFGAVSKVYLPADEGVEASFWFLAKAYVVVNDSGYHQLISHWLNTHAAIEPFIIATNRHLSVLHPINKLLHPHFKDNMFINALARENLISANGIIETSFLPEQYSMEVSSKVYKNWIFPEQALPADLIKRGVAVEDSTQPRGLRLLIKDYPYAVDGLDIWAAIEKWVQDYVNYYYEKDDTIQQDFELQKWWKELVEVGHGDLADKPWWPKMRTRKDLIDSCSIIIWCSSALHAAVNFGQFPYGGYIPNRPTLSRRFIPEKGTPEYDELLKNPEVAFLKTITPKYETLLDLSIIEILSGHTTDEVYLGTRNDANWTSDIQPLAAFKEFGKKIAEIGDIIIKRNEDLKLKNRVGSVKMPYTLLYPSSEPGLTGKGIPNSISI